MNCHDISPISQFMSQPTTWRQAKPEHLDGRPHRVARHRHAGAIFKRRWMLSGDVGVVILHVKICEVFGSVRRCLEVFGSAWKCLEVFGSAWKCLEVFGSVRKCLEVFGSAWKCLEVFGSAWKCLEVFGSVWKCLEVFGSVWKCLEVFGSVWKCLEVFGSVWKCLEVFGSVWKDHADDHLIPFMCIKWWSECSDCSRMMLHFFPCSDVFTIDWIRCSKLSQKRYAYYIYIWLYIYRSSLFNIVQRTFCTKRANLCSTVPHTNHFRLTATTPGGVPSMAGWGRASASDAGQSQDWIHVWFTLHLIILITTSHAVHICISGFLRPWSVFPLLCTCKIYMHTEPVTWA